MSKIDERTFVLKLWGGIFFALAYISPFKIVRVIFGKDKKDGSQAFVNTYLFVDAWVTGNLILSFLSICFVKYMETSLVSRIIVIYGLVRVFEIFVYQVNVLLFDDYRADVKEEKVRNKQNYALRSYRRLILLLLNNFVEIIFWFSAAYLYFATFFTSDIRNNTLLEIIYKSFVMMTNFGSATMAPKTPLGIIIIWFESIIGLLMTLLVLARFIGMLPKPATLDKNEHE